MRCAKAIAPELPSCPACGYRYRPRSSSGLGRYVWASIVYGSAGALSVAALAIGLILVWTGASEPRVLQGRMSTLPGWMILGGILGNVYGIWTRLPTEPHDRIAAKFRVFLRWARLFMVVLLVFVVIVLLINSLDGC